VSNSGRIARKFAPHLTSARNRMLRGKQLRIVNVLGAYGKEGCGAKILAKDLKWPLRTVQWHLRRLVSAEVVEQPFRGHYVYVPEEMDLTAFPGGIDGCHGITLVSGRLRGGIPPLVSLRDPAEWPAKEGFPRIREVRLDWEGRDVRLWYYSGTMRFRVMTQNDRNPIPWVRMREFMGWLNGLFHPLSVNEWLLVEIGVNVDYPNLRMEGLKAATFQSWVNAVERAYQKLAYVLRNEVHTAAMDEAGRILPFDKVIEKLVEGSPVRRMERMLEKELELERMKQETLRLQESNFRAGMVPPGTRGNPPPPDASTGYG
jgi:hypothetical protein